MTKEDTYYQFSLFLMTESQNNQLRGKLKSQDLELGM
jgi:hypothetical protein